MLETGTLETRGLEMAPASGLGPPIAEYQIAAATAFCYRVKAGQYIQIIDSAGSQCSDLLSILQVRTIKSNWMQR